MPTHASRRLTPAPCLLRRLPAFLPRLTGRRRVRHTGLGLTLQSHTTDGYTVTNPTLYGRPLGMRQASWD